MHLFRACAFVAKPDGRNRTPLHELEKREVLSAWKETKRGTEQAIGILGVKLGLVTWIFLVWIPNRSYHRVVRHEITAPA